MPLVRMPVVPIISGVVLQLVTVPVDSLVSRFVVPLVREPYLTEKLACGDIKTLFMIH